MFQIDSSFTPSIAKLDVNCNSFLHFLEAISALSNDMDPGRGLVWGRDAFLGACPKFDAEKIVAIGALLGLVGAFVT